MLRDKTRESRPIAEDKTKERSQVKFLNSLMGIDYIDQVRATLFDHFVFFKYKCNTFFFLNRRIILVEQLCACYRGKGVIFSWQELLHHV